MKPGKDEDKITPKLCNILKEKGFDMSFNSERRPRKRIDIEVALGNVHVAIECEKYGSGKRAEAVKDAVSRLYPEQMVNVALAVVYPKECVNEDDFKNSSMLDYAIVTKENADRYKEDHKKHAKYLEWRQCAAGVFHNIVKHLPRNLGEPSKMAADLNNKLENAIHSFSESQYQRLGTAIDLTFSTISDMQKREQLEVAAGKRALLVVASASLFHARLDDHIMELEQPKGAKSWPPPTLQECYDDTTNIKVMLSEAWGIILEYDYRPIFEAAKNVLAASNDVQFVNAVRDMVRWALDTVGQIGGLQHDLLGRLFHAVLDTAQSDGSYYTTTPAAVMLARLALRDASDLPDDPAKMRILDPACGTGTLLMAAGERMLELAPGIRKASLIEDILHGIDINVTATHMAATTLGLLSPTTKFNKMNIGVAPFGIVEHDNERVGRAGSLEMYDDEGLLPAMDWFTGPSKQVDTDQTIHVDKHSMDLVIMNPPFTRNALRHDQLGPDVEKRVKEREANIFSKAEVQPSRSSSGPMFMLLAEKLQSNVGTFAAVRPTVAANDYSERETRPFLAEKYHIDTIVVPHDPKRFYFSENTDIWEMLTVMRRGKKEKTRIIKLARNPDTVAEAAALADRINADEGGGDYHKVMWPRSRIEQGDWSGVLFFSQFLADRFVDIRDGTMFTSTRLGDIASTGQPPQGIRDIFTTADDGDVHGRYARCGHNTNEVRSMHGVPNKYLIVKRGKEKKAKSVWDDGCTYLQITERVRLNTARVFAVYVNGQSIGTSWHSIKPLDKDNDQSIGTSRHTVKPLDKDNDQSIGTSRHTVKPLYKDNKKWAKAMSVYLNSTLGVVALLGIRTPRIMSYPHFGVEDIRSIPVPKLSKRKISGLVKIYEKYKDDDLGLLQNPTNIREAIDEAVSKTLRIKNHRLVYQMRTELSREPMVTNRRYNETPLDSYAR